MTGRSLYRIDLWSQYVYAGVAGVTRSVIPATARGFANPSLAYPSRARLRNQRGPECSGSGWCNDVAPARQALSR
jgi:hypothetical protein